MVWSQVARSHGCGQCIAPTDWKCKPTIPQGIIEGALTVSISLNNKVSGVVAYSCSYKSYFIDEHVGSLDFK